MKLFTKSIDNKLFAQFPKGGSLEGQKVIAKIFNPYGRGRWYVMNSDPDDPDYLWGIVELFDGEPEVGSFSRSELENLKVGKFRLPLERDLYFDEVNASELYKGLLSGDRYEKGGKLSYNPKSKISNATIMYEGKEYLVSSDDLITGAYKLAKGGLTDNYVYIPKRDVLKITTNDGKTLKNTLNGVWVKKSYFSSSESKSSGKYEPSQATKVFAYKLTELSKDKEMKKSSKDRLIADFSINPEFLDDLKYEVENNIYGLALKTYATAIKDVAKSNKGIVAKDLTVYGNANVINIFPEELLKTPILSKKSIAISGNILDNKSILDELNKFTSEDKYRPAMTSIQFDGKDVVATNAHILVHLRNESDVEKQSICMSKLCKDTKGDSEKYPDWRNIIARNLDDSKYKSHTFDLDKLILFTNWINNYYSVTKYSLRQLSLSTKNGEIAFNPEFLLKVLTMLKVLGIKKPIMYYENYNRAVYFGEEGKLKGDPLNDNFILVMPLMAMTETIFSYDLSNNNYKIVTPEFEYAKGGELEMGIKTEMKEHGMDKAEATKTAKDHLRENPRYYSIMKKVGLEDGGQIELFEQGGATFDEKVRAIKRNLVGKKVPSKYQKEYGKKYDKNEAEESAKRIAGSMRKKYNK